MMGTRQKLRGGSEYDALTRFRRHIRLRRGEAARTKRQFWKRTRKEAQSGAESEATDALE